MRFTGVLVLLIVSLQLSARTAPGKDVEPWRAHFGLMAGMNNSVMQMHGGYYNFELSTMQWTAAFGVYFRSAQRNMYRFEIQSGYEVDGSGREIFFRRDEDTYVRIFDRYRTIPLTMLLCRNLGWKEVISVGLGFKSSFIVNYGTRHPGTMETAGIILTPDPIRWFGSPVLQLSGSFAFADVALCGWYAVTPVIDQFGVKASPYGVTLLVKARIANIGD